MCSVCVCVLHRGAFSSQLLSPICRFETVDECLPWESIIEAARPCTSGPRSNLPFRDAAPYPINITTGNGRSLRRSASGCGLGAELTRGVTAVSLAGWEFVIINTNHVGTVSVP